MKLTQRQRLLQAFEEKGHLYVYEIMAPRPNGLGISQYGARIKELREMGHPIINKKPGLFVYEADTASRKDTMAYNPRSNPDWEKLGRYLKGKAPKPVNEYESKTVEELVVLRDTATQWLRDNEDHPKYLEALERYEKICDALIKLNLTTQEEYQPSQEELV